MRFFFDVENGRLTEDDDGSDHGSVHEARDAAIAMLPLVARQELLDGCCDMVAVTLRDERGEALFKASLSLYTEWLAEPDQPDKVLASK